MLSLVLEIFKKSVLGLVCRSVLSFLYKKYRNTEKYKIGELFFYVLSRHQTENVLGSFIHLQSGVPSVPNPLRNPDRDPGIEVVSGPGNRTGILARMIFDPGPVPGSGNLKSLVKILKFFKKIEKIFGK